MLSPIDKTQKTVKLTQAGQTPIHSALIGGALSEVAKSRPKLDYSCRGQKAIERWNITQRPFDRNPGITRCGSRFAFCLLALCHALPRLCISVKPVGRLLRKLRRATFSLPNFSFTGSWPNALPRRHAPLNQGVSVRTALGATVCCSFWEQHIFPCRQSFIGTLSPRHTHHPNAWRGKLIILPLKIFVVVALKPILE